MNTDEMKAKAKDFFNDAWLKTQNYLDEKREKKLAETQSIRNEQENRKAIAKGEAINEQQEIREKLFGKEYRIPLKYPEKLSLEKFDKYKAIITFPASRCRFRWIPFAFAFVAIPLSIWFGFVSGFVNSNYRLSTWSSGPLIFFAVLSVGLSYAVYKGFWRNITVVITPDFIDIEGRRYDRQHVGVFTLGYTVEGESVGNTITDHFSSEASLGANRLRLQYGQWGEFLNWMVNGSIAAQYVIFLNMLLAEVGAPPPSEYDTERGVRPSGL